MLCNNCRREIGNQKICIYCGCDVINYDLKNDINHDFNYNHNYSFDNNQGNYFYPMKWYNFIVKYGIFISAIWSCLISILYFTGNIRETNGVNDASTVYEIYGGLQAADIFYGVMSLVYAALFLYTRDKLKKYQKDGPLFYYISNIVMIAANIIYQIWQCEVVGYDVFEPLMSSFIGSVIGSIIHIVLTYVYFSKRKDLFLN